MPSLSSATLAILCCKNRFIDLCFAQDLLLCKVKSMYQCLQAWLTTKTLRKDSAAVASAELKGPQHRSSGMIQKQSKHCPCTSQNGSAFLAIAAWLVHSHCNQLDCYRSDQQIAYPGLLLGRSAAKTQIG